MNIQLDSERNMTLDLDKATSMLLVGTCGTGKTYTIKDILRQVKASGEPMSVVYLDEHESDYFEVNLICGELLNKTGTLKPNELKSLAVALKEQRIFRTSMLREVGVTELKQLRGRMINLYCVGGKMYQPDDIVCRFEDGLQKFYLVKDLYERMTRKGDSIFVNSTYIGEYKPTRMIICLDEFYTSDMPKSVQTGIHNMVKDVIRFGRLLHQNVILSTQRLSQHKGYRDLVDIVDVKMLFHPIHEASDYEVLFGKKPEGTSRRGIATIKTQDECRTVGTLL